MKYSKSTIILTILFSITLFALGLFNFDRLFEIIVPKVDGGFYQATDLGGLFNTKLLFSLVLGLTPVFIFLTWRLSPIISGNKKLGSVLTVILFMTLSIIVRQQILISYFTGLTKTFNLSVDKVTVSFPVDQLNFEYYLSGGLIIGCLISYFLLRQKRIKM